MVMRSVDAVDSNFPWRIILWVLVKKVFGWTGGMGGKNPLIIFENFVHFLSTTVLCLQNQAK